MSWKLIFVVLAATAGLESALAQSWVALQPQSDLSYNGRLRLLSVEGLVEYTAKPSPFSPITSDVQTPSRFGQGASAAVGYSSIRDRSQFSWSFMSTYTQRVRESGWSAWTNSMDLGWNRRMTSRIGLGVRLTGALGSTKDLQFMPGSQLRLAQSGGSAGDLASAVTSSTNPAMANALITTSVLDPQTLATLYGQTALGVDGEAYLSYAYSPRLAFQWTVGAARAQPWRPSEAGPSSSDLVSRSSTGYVGMGTNYVLSPRTQIGFYISTQRSRSRIQEGYTLSAIASFGRLLTRRWFVNLQGGMASQRPVRTAQIGSEGVTYQGVGSLGYRNSSHTVLFRASRIASDYYGVGASATVEGDISWYWRRPGSGWWLTSEVNVTQLSSAESANTSRTADLRTVRVLPSLGRRLTGSTAVQLQYLFTDYATLSPGALQNGRYEHTVRLAVVWIPGAIGR